MEGEEMENVLFSFEYMMAKYHVTEVTWNTFEVFGYGLEFTLDSVSQPEMFAAAAEAFGKSDAFEVE